MSNIKLNNINKYFSENHVLKDLNLEVGDGEFMTLLGPSGCGKSTTLRVIAGLENPEQGTLTIGDTEVVNGERGYYASASSRELNLVFQSYALWPHMTVFDNVSFGLHVKKYKKSKIKQEVQDALQRMQIENLMNRYPSELSGGQQQRVAIARAIVTRPKVLLLDEPLSNLDAKLRVEMRAELKRLHHDLKTTIVYVTHDQVEALTMSTKIAVFFDGELVQVDTPQNVYHKPSDLRVAEFIGNPAVNFVNGSCITKSGQLMVNSLLGDFNIDYKEDFKNMPEDVVLSLKPEDIKISSENIKTGIQCRVESVLPAGSETLINVLKDNKRILLKIMGDVSYKLDEKVWITFPSDKINLYNKDTQKIIRNQLAEVDK